MTRRQILTGAERQQRHREARRLAGHRQVTVWLDCLAVAILEDRQRKTGETQEEIINRALVEAFKG